MSKENEILNQLKKAERPSVPNGYFDEFASNLKLDADDTSFLEALPKSKKPDVPEEFFTEFTNKLAPQLDHPKKGEVISLKQIFISAASVAAMVAIIFFATNNTQVATIAETEYDTEEYLAFVDFDESEYIDFIIENNISFDEEIDEEVLYELESELDDYYYDL